MTYGYLMATRNQAGTLAKAVEAVLAQHADQFVVVNDCSTDDTLPILKAMQANGAKLTIVSNPVQMGGNATYNSMLPSMETDYVCLPASDDLLCATHLHELRKGDAFFPGLLMGALQIHRGDVTWRVCHDLETGYYSPDEQVRLAQAGRWQINCQTAFIRRDLLGRGYRKELGCVADWRLCQDAAFSGGCWRSKWVVGHAYLGPATWGMKNPPQWNMLLYCSKHRRRYIESGLIGRHGFAAFDIRYVNPAYVNNLMRRESVRLANKVLPTPVIKLLTLLLA